MSDTEKKRTSEEFSGIASNLLSLWEPWFKIGASMARTVAQSTAGGKEVAEPEPGANSLSAIVHYGWATVGNVIGVLASGVDVMVKPTDGAPEGVKSPPGESPPHMRRIPTVHRGSTLRVPLSIENPGNGGDYDLSFSCARVTVEDAGSGNPLNGDAVRLEPGALVVAPYDFEKLTVLIDTTEATATGIYEAVIVSAGKDFEIPLHFSVV